MKRIICFVLSCLLAFTMAAPVTTAAAKKVCTCKHVTAKKHHKKHHHYRTYYSPGYCEEYASACGTDVVCYTGYSYKCWTDYYYHSGRNTARVEICR